MLPASTTCRNRLRSTRSKCMRLSFAVCEGKLDKMLVVPVTISSYFVIGEHTKASANGGDAGQRGPSGRSQSPIHGALRRVRTLDRNHAKLGKAGLASEG